MGGVVELTALAAAMGLSIFLSLPVILAKSTASRTITLLNAAAIGILLFLLADIFADAATLVYTNPVSPYLADPARAVYFVLGVAGCFGLLYFLSHRSGAAPLSPTGTAVVVAAAIGLQNLTEGLVFGAAWAVGAIGLSSVVFVGFFLQNITEGFPITSPLIGQDVRRLGTVAAVFLLGGVPTILGAVGGFYYNSPTLDVVFEALAIGAILYALLPMLRIALRPAEDARVNAVRQRLVYAGLLAGFLAGFLVNAV
jgi:ZIP family zinc transporter